MKTKPAKLLMTMLLGIGSMALVSTAALADNNNNNGNSDNSNKNSDNSGKDSSGSSSSTPSCTGQPMSTCGLNIVKITCTGSAISTSSKDKSGNEEGDDSNHKSKDKDSKNKNDRDYNDDMHKDHADHSNDSVGNKISICHRMGGAEVSLTVANDGWASGHSKHDMDTIGRCADFDADKSSDDSKADKDKDSKISLSDKGYNLGVTTTQIACLKGSPNTSYTIGGKTYQGAGLNGNNVSVAIKGQSLTTTPTSSQGANQGSNSSSSRGGAKNLH